MTKNSNTPPKSRPKVATPWAFRWKGGYIISWDSLEQALKGADVLEFKGVQVGADRLRLLAKAMARNSHCLLTPISLNGGEPKEPFQGPGLQIEVGPEIERTEDGRKIRWKKADRKPFYSRIRVADGAWLRKMKGTPTLVRLKPKLIKDDKQRRATTS